LSRRGFTLLEVMVAVAILGLSLTVILSAQAGLYTSSTYAQHTSVAIGLARCKMTEVEQKLLKMGYPEIDQNDEGACCEDDTQTTMKCKWKIEKVELPQGATVDLASALGSASPSGSSSPLGPLSALTEMGKAATSGDAGAAGLVTDLKQGMGGSGAIASLVMGLVYPQLKPMLEASMRKVTVAVTWNEGLRERDLTITQYVTYPAKAVPIPGTVGSDGLPPGGTNPVLPPGGGAGGGGK
jgi:general secretion pathway protein I